MPESEKKNFKIGMGERLMFIRNALKYTNASAFARKIDMVPQNLVAIERGARPIPDTTILKICELWPDVSYEWLKLGKGNPPVFNGESKLTILKESPISYQKKPATPAQIPLYNVEFSAGIVTKLQEARYTPHIMAMLSVEYFPELQGCDAVIQAKGDSMAPEVNDKDYLGIKFMHDKTVVPPGYMYGIITGDLMMVKYIRKAKDPEMYLIRSHNPLYEDFELPKNKVDELYMIKCVIPAIKIKCFV